MSIKLPEDGSCAFCAYLKEERPYTILWREARVAVLVTREQRGIDHLLVIPVHHYATLLDIPNDDAQDLFLALRDAAASIAKTNGPDGIAVWQNNGVAAGQAIGHAHFHVAGTLPGGGTQFGDVEEVPLSFTDEIAARLAKQVDQTRRAVFPFAGGTTSVP